MLVQFTVFGYAAPGGSKKAFVVMPKGTVTIEGRTVLPKGARAKSVVVDANPRAKDWKQTVAASAREVYSGPLLDGALKVTMKFFVPRPKSHYGKTGLNKTGRDMPAPTGMPDLLKTARSTEDALTGVVWRNDSIIVDEILRKRWGEPARCEITIETENWNGEEGSLFQSEET